MSALKAGEDFINSLAKNLSTSYGEIASEIAGNYTNAVSRDIKGKVIKATINEGLEQADKLINTLAKGPDAKFAKEMAETVSSSKISDKEKFNWIRKKQVERHGSELLGNAVFAGQAVKAYMFQDGKKAARIGTYAVGSVGLRVLSGGTLTHNNTGERDIAGIPFI